MKKIAFLISSVGDTDLALATIKSLESKLGHEVLIISLTKTAQDRATRFQSPALVAKRSLPEILEIENNIFPEGFCTGEQLSKLVDYMRLQGVNQIYCGVPSVNSHIPFQLATAIKDTPVLMAYEFMYKQDNHYLWQHLPTLKSKGNIQWALPLAAAASDFQIEDKSNMHFVGHLSIDSAFAAKPASVKTSEAIRESLHVVDGQSLAFVSSTTQPVAIDATFLHCLLEELPKHPSMQVRFGLHPGIQVMDDYLMEILSVYKKHQAACSSQFKIILPVGLLEKIKYPDLTINNPLFQDVFLRENINGNEASSAADRVAQAVPGALLNQGALEGKPSYSHAGKPYLPREYFADSIATFFTAAKQPARNKLELGLDEQSTSERCASILLKQ